jgi:hypothetical protein
MNRLSAHFFLIVLVLLLAASVQAGTIGNPAIAAPNFDTCNGCTFVLLQAFPVADAGENVAFYSLFANNVGNPFTPLIFTETAAGIFTVSGVGTTQNISLPGFQRFSFGLTAGSSLVGSTTFFGYRDGTVSVGTGTNASDTIAFSGPPAGPGAQIRYFGSAGSGPSPNIFLGEAFNSGGSAVGGLLGGVSYTSTQLARIYSLQATATTIPEPSAIFLMFGGVIMLWIVRRKLA